MPILNEMKTSPPMSEDGRRDGASAPCSPDGTSAPIRTPRRRAPHLMLPLLLMLGTLVLLSGAKCHEPGTRVIVFVQGLYTTYDADGTQNTAPEGPRFSTLKRAFIAAGYDADVLLDFSYN